VYVFMVVLSQVCVVERQVLRTGAGPPNWRRCDCE
jgi:hypothetical protein